MITWLWGSRCYRLRGDCESRPLEPDPDNAGAGKRFRAASFIPFPTSGKQKEVFHRE